MEVSIGKMRNSSFELLRLVLMFMIIFHHSIIHGLGFSGLGLDENAIVVLNSNLIPIATVLNCLCICAVNCFILISGYFSINLNLKKFITLLVTVILYTLVFNTGYLLYEGEWRSALASLLIFSHSNYWFVKDYLYLMLFAPAINSAFSNIGKTYLNILIIAMLFISCYLGFFWGNSVNETGYTLFQFIMIYSIGRYIRLNNIKFGRLSSLLLYVVPGIICGLAMGYLWIHGNHTLAIKVTYYNNPLIIISSIGLFLVFLELQFRSSLINSIAKSSFAIYLVQSSLWCWSFFYRMVYKSANYVGGFSLKLSYMPF